MWRAIGSFSWLNHPSRDHRRRRRALVGGELAAPRHCVRQEHPKLDLGPVIQPLYVSRGGIEHEWSAVCRGRGQVKKPAREMIAPFIYLGEMGQWRGQAADAVDQAIEHARTETGVRRRRHAAKLPR